MRGLLVRLFPRSWRDRYGEGFADLLAGTPLNVAVVVDCLCSAVLAHVRLRRLPVAVVAAAIWFAAMNVVAIRTGVTVNILWAPTSPGRGLLLLVAVVPPVAMVRQAACRLAPS